MLLRPINDDAAPSHQCDCISSLLKLAAALFITCRLSTSAPAQDASLLLAPPLPQQPGQLTLENSSFIYRRLPPEAELRELKIHDIVTVLVDYRSSMMSEGDAAIGWPSMAKTLSRRLKTMATLP
jgi:hypothetical protein